MGKTWKQIYEDQIAGMADMSDASKVTLLQNSLRACAEAFDRMEASTNQLIAATTGEKKCVVLEIHTESSTTPGNLYELISDMIAKGRQGPKDDGDCAKVDA